jgi:hypothetical protein
VAHSSAIITITTTAITATAISSATAGVTASSITPTVIPATKGQKTNCWGEGIPKSIPF